VSERGQSPALALADERSYDQPDNENGPAARQRPGPGIGGIAPMRKQVSQARRVRVDRGIYKRTSSGPTVYEITFVDSGGRQRWQTIEGGLREARRARADVVSKLGRGERVVRSHETLAEYVERWLPTLESQLRERTLQSYERNLKRHVLPQLGRLKITEIQTDDVAGLIAQLRRAGYAGWTIRTILTPLSRLFSHAARRGVIAGNPMSRLERGERPPARSREHRILHRDEIGLLLSAATPRYRTLLATAIFTGLRQGELLALRWEDVDFANRLVRVRKALDRQGRRLDPKTPQAVRDVVLMPALAQLLREHRLRSPYSAAEDFVFASAAGSALYWRNVARRRLADALNSANLPHVRWHDLRHTFASVLIAEGANVVYVSRQLGHASPDITLRVYAHLFDRAEQAHRTSQALEAAFGAMVAT
jgi:integrase